MSIERWTHATDFVAAVDDLKHGFEDRLPGSRLERFEIRYSPEFEAWLVEHPLWRKLVDLDPNGPRHSIGGWALCDCVHLVPSTVCPGLASFGAVLEGGRWIPWATLVGGPA